MKNSVSKIKKSLLIYTKLSYWFEIIKMEFKLVKQIQWPEFKFGLNLLLLLQKKYEYIFSPCSYGLNNREDMTILPWCDNQSRRKKITLNSKYVCSPDEVNTNHWKDYTINCGVGLWTKNITEVEWWGEKNI